MRLDLTVNILTNHAVNKGAITVFGGSQKRPNIHIEDITDLYVQLLDLPDDMIAGEIFNASYQNHTVAEIAEIVRSEVEKKMPEKAPIQIKTTPSDDLRSYHVTSRKIKEKLGYIPKRSLEDAVSDICDAFEAGKLSNSFTDDRYYNVNTVKKVGLK